MVSCKMFEGLVVIDNDRMPQPQLAESWDISDDGLRYEFHLRKGVTWHDGKPLTSADVKWTFENVTAKYGPRAVAAFERVESIETPDDHTVVVNMREPYGPFINLMTCMSAAILPQHIYGDGDITTHPRNTDDPVGTGPFVFEEWVPGSHVTLTAYENYWRRSEGMPYLDGITLRIISDSTAAISALEAGEIDLINAYSLPAADFDRLKDDPRFRALYNTMTPSNDVLIFNVTRPPFDDRRVRHAFAHAIDRQRIVDTVNFGQGRTGKSAVDSRLGWAHNPAIDYDEIYPFDPDRAMSLLDEAGYTPDSNGVRLRVRLTYDSREESVQMGQIIREQLRAVGVEVELEQLERTSMIDKVYTTKDFDMTIVGYNTTGDVALGVQRIYITSAIGPQPFTNASGYSNPEVDRLFAEGAAAHRPEDRAPAYFRVQEILAEEIPSLVLTEAPQNDLVRAELKDVERGGDSWFHLFEEAYYSPAG